jgi:hypothetical protein
MGILKSIAENNLMDRYLDTLVHCISVSVFYLPHKVCLHVMVLGCYKNVPYARLALYRGNYNIQMYIGHQKIVAISEFGVIKRGDKMREHCIWEKNPLKIANLFIKGTYMFSLQCPL